MTIPTHSLHSENSRIVIEDLGYQNPYDFSKEHRHTYYEIFLFDKGGGSQLIDFLNYDINENSCYIVFPKQIHLLKRKEESSGKIIQFHEEDIPSSVLAAELTELRLNGSVKIFENDPGRVNHLTKSLNAISENKKELGTNGRHAERHLFAAFLHQLLVKPVNYKAKTQSPDQNLVRDFQNLLEKKYKQQHKVVFYISGLDTTEKKLTSATKKLLGLTPLKLIHNRILLEAKRLLLFEELSSKELAYELGFETPPAFSQFIKSKTEKTPTELREQLLEIHKQ
ncbi:MAG: helix-turn-helix transcriptional regulator [Flavobacteriales bacterium]|nr:helix-turn-helix transcriptional regulator [Flavobacteriales bacterium]